VIALIRVHSLSGSVSVGADVAPDVAVTCQTSMYMSASKAGAVMYDNLQLSLQPFGGTATLEVRYSGWCSMLAKHQLKDT
jgi:hypothetical protein